MSGRQKGRKKEGGRGKLEGRCQKGKQEGSAAGRKKEGGRGKLEGRCQAGIKAGRRRR